MVYRIRNIESIAESIKFPIFSVFCSRRCIRLAWFNLARTKTEKNISNNKIAFDMNWSINILYDGVIAETYLVLLAN